MGRFRQFIGWTPEMDLTNPLETGLAILGAAQLAKQGQDFIGAVSGRPGESVGMILGNLLNRRIQNVEAVGNKAHYVMLNLGLKAGEVELPVLQPILEGASLQEDSYMQDTWANLLANASDPRKLNEVPPSFPAMLKELGPREVKFLDALYK